MSIRQVNDAVTTAIQHAETAAGTCPSRPTISDADAQAIADAVGSYAGTKEIAALTRLASFAQLSTAGQSAMEAAMRRPVLTDAIRKANRHEMCSGADPLLHAGGAIPALGLLGIVAAVGCLMDSPKDGDAE